MTELFSTSDRQATVIPEEEENYLRIANLLIRVAPSAVRIQFNNEFYPGALKSVLNKNRLNILEPLTRKRIINQAQWDLLFSVTEICEDTVGEWKKENVADTRAIRRLSEIMTTHNVAVAVGPSGCGKSTAIHYIALQLALKHEYAIIIVYNPEDIRQFYDPDCKQVFVIDDVFGIATFDENKAIKWLNMSKDIKKILSYNQAKLLASCRTHIFQHRIAKTVGVLADLVVTLYQPIIA